MRIFLLTPLLLSTIVGLPARETRTSLRDTRWPLTGECDSGPVARRSRQDSSDLDLAGTRLRIAWREERGRLTELRVRRLAGLEPLVCLSWCGPTAEPVGAARWFALPEDRPAAIHDLPLPGSGDPVWLRLVGYDGRCEQAAFYPGR